MLGTTAKLSVSSSRVVITLERIFLGLGLTVTEINIKKVQKQEIKNIKNVKKMWGWCAKKYTNKVGMIA